jgi:hypothetical protein
LPKCEKLKIKKNIMSQIPSNFGKKSPKNKSFEVVLPNL